MYSATITVLTVLGLLLSAFFVLTWLPSAALLLVRGTLPKRFGRLEVFDITALPLGIFVLYTISTVNLLTVGVQPAPSLGVVAGRILSVVLFDLFVGLRAWRWGRILFAGGPATLAERHGAYSDHHHALEGSHDSQNVHPSEHA